MMTLRDSVFKYIKDKYMADPEYLWRRYLGYAVFRHGDNNKWFAVVMDVARDKVGLNDEERIDILDIKVSDPLFADALVSQKGFCRAYHLNKANWVTVFLDGTVSMKTICSLIDDSFIATASARKKEKVRPPKEWVIPANPKYYDIVHAFDEADEINWKQGSGIKTGDTVFMYLGTVTVYSHLQACGMINDHGNDCPCYKKIVREYPTVKKNRDKEKSIGYYGG